MRLSADIIENPNRRPYHMVVGSIIVTLLFATIAVGVRATIG